MEKKSYIYLITNDNNSVIYTGVTSDLRKRINEHKQKAVKGFSKKYNIHKLVYYEVFSDVRNAIQREKQIKSGSRKKKIALIEKENINWDDLSQKIF